MLVNLEITVVSLHGELRTLRDGICTSCKRIFQVPTNLVSSKAAEYNSIFSWRRLLKAHAYDIPCSSVSSTPEIRRLFTVAPSIPQPFPIPISIPSLPSAPPHRNKTPVSLPLPSPP